MSTKRILFRGRHLEFIDADGWEYAHRPQATGVVILVPITDDDRIVLVEQYRIPVAATVIELPAGLAGDIQGEEDEPLVAAARRELLEETGYEAADIELLTEGPPSPGVSSEVTSFFLARGLRKTGPGGGDEDESITVREVPLGELDAWLLAARERGAMVDPKLYAGLWLAARHSPAAD